MKHGQGRGRTDLCVNCKVSSPARRAATTSCRKLPEFLAGNPKYAKAGMWSANTLVFPCTRNAYNRVSMHVERFAGRELSQLLSLQEAHQIQKYPGAPCVIMEVAVSRSVAAGVHNLDHS